MADMEPRTWDYHLESAPDGARLAVLGGEGWELVAIDPKHGRYVFKRPRPSFRDRVTLEQKSRYYRLWGIDKEREA